MRLNYVPIVGVVLAALLTACAGTRDEGSVTLPMLVCEDAGATWDDGERLLDAGMHSKLELTADKRDRMLKIWNDLGGAEADRFFLFKLPNNDTYIYVIVTFGPCVIHEEVIPAEPLMKLLAGRQPTRGSAA